MIFSLARFRLRLADVDALPQLSLLALAAGLLTGVVMITFRLAITLPLTALLPGGDEAFETLPQPLVFLLPTLGGLLLGVIFLRLAPEKRSVGVTHVMERLARHQGHTPATNAWVQFLGGSLALLTGQSAGREGPAIHLGAAVSSLLGQRLRLPNNSIRTLVGCGTAAAIAASFNTPLAGVIFAMEVVMMEYSVVSFIPLIIASVSATLVSIAVFGYSLAFEIPPITSAGLWETPFFALEGVFLGLLAALFIQLVRALSRFAERPVWQRFVAAGALTGLAGLVAAEVLGVGYDTVNAALAGKLGLAALVTIGLLKFLVSAVSTSLGLPAGCIGPLLVIGALAGSAFGLFGGQFWPGDAPSAGLHALVGMAAMMGAVLQAPLAALITVLELTGDPATILPAMITIVAASLISSTCHGPRSLFLIVLETRGLTLDTNPFTLALQRTGVSSQMERRIAQTQCHLTPEDAQAILAQEPRWIIVNTEEGPTTLLAAADLRRYLETLNMAESGAPASEAAPPQDLIDLLAIPGLRKDLVLLHSEATLHEAMQYLKETGREAVCVTRSVAPMITPVVGVLTREDIEKHYGLRG